MWWITLVAGLVAVCVGGLHLGRYFSEGSGHGRSMAGSGPAHRLVAAAMYTAGGLFLSFFSIANLIAAYAGGP